MTWRMSLLAGAMIPTIAVAQTAPLPAPAPKANATLSDRVPVETFAKLPGIANPKLSPDGRRIAAKMAIDGVQVLVVAPLFPGGKLAAIKVGATVDINWWRWVGDDWLAVGIGSQDMLYGEEIYVTRTLGVKADMTKINRIDWKNSGVRADEILWAARDGTPRVLLSRQTGIESESQWYPAVAEVDLSTGKTKTVAGSQTNVFDWYADGAGVVRMGYRYDDDTRKSSLLYRSANRDPFKVIASARGKQDIVIPVTFRADGTAIATDDSGGRDEVFEVSLPDLKLGKKLYGADSYDVDGVIDNATGDDIDGITVTDRFGHIVWLNPKLKEIQDAVDKAVGERRARIVSWDRTRSKFLVQVGSPSQAGALYFYDPANGSMQRYSWQNNDLKARTLSPVSTIRYKARDGVEIEALLTLPRGHSPKNLPLIVLPHGGPFARDSEDWDWWTQYLAETGYAVIQPNYRGSSGYGTSFAKLGEGQWGLKMQDDLDDAIVDLAKKGIADPKRVCMAGASYGGYTAMRAAQRNGTGDAALYRCAISYAGVSDLQAMQRYDGKFLYGKTRGDWLKKQAPDYRSVSPRFGAQTFSIPILMLHGKEDKRVPVKQSRMMAAALKEAGKSFEYIEQPLGDHHFTRGEDRLEFLKAMGAFLTKYNPA
ncbi:peptidase [Sphingomonas sp. Leaf208]|jgi:dipeptidyl aminopeptidase/acylaminoacyl peptidase|uniref:alpha/beta hydrolase family protein n=1 Tax=Sphingomonas sp. Leaf208 TaxID=1735679 RepID=UPI0006FC19E7|nr:S9 family peptidase [Sphingomonas sp. Leaf208]KQM49285.1 peptidase [Sphingomonas sp. Leaf208]RZL81336.1 MAG: S9 family peptidase [Sphingomonas sp.]